MTVAEEKKQFWRETPAEIRDSVLHTLTKYSREMFAEAEDMRATGHATSTERLAAYGETVRAALAELGSDVTALLGWEASDSAYRESVMMFLLDCRDDMASGAQIAEARHLGRRSDRLWRYAHAYAIAAEALGYEDVQAENELLGPVGRTVTDSLLDITRQMEALARVVGR